MSNRTPGVIALVGGLALYGVYAAVSQGRIKLNEYGDDYWISWADNPVGFGFMVATMGVVGGVLLWIAWRQWRDS